MITEVQVKVFPDQLSDLAFIKNVACKRAKIVPNDSIEMRIRRRSIDARKGRPAYILLVQLFTIESSPKPLEFNSRYKDVSKSKSVVIVGAGPAGYYAALELVSLGFKPIVLERGKDVQARRRDLRAIQQFSEVNPHSNYCFGEGGAGTYSDGKLYTRANKRGDIKKALQILVDHGAVEDILVDAHPHIGSNKLPKIVANMRETILAHGGEVHFNTFVDDFIIKDNQMVGVRAKEKEFIGESVILATGHSARDIYNLCVKAKVHVEDKPFALGVRIEHSQELIDKIQYRQQPREEGLPAASYGLTCQVDDEGVFSFCMCPGGIIVPAATSPGEIVVNGMSLSKRNSPFANSGFVTAVGQKQYGHLIEEFGPLAALEYQRRVEQKVFEVGDGSQAAPAQRLKDFVSGKTSSSALNTSYIPGLHEQDLNEVLPDYISHNLKEALKIFDRKMNGYYTNEAQIVATESRTSAPVKIPRDRETGEHIQIKRLFPCGEGAGYAGGIISAAMDGINMANCAVKMYLED